MSAFDLSAFFDQGVSDIVGRATKFYARSPKGLRFVARTALSFAAADKRRRQMAQGDGIEVPVFLIASISSTCNLTCTGCYAHANKTIGQDARSKELTDEQWQDIFREARDIGISFILLAGGEPTMRKDVVKGAAKVTDIIFPVFTNGTTMDDEWMAFFDDNRNMVPVFSVEGTDEQTDARRGAGVAERVIHAMGQCTKKRILWGVSITATTDNLDEVTSDGFVGELHRRGCGLIIYNEYVPFAHQTAHLALKMADHDQLMDRVNAITAKDSYGDMIAIAFPGSEEEMGGCLAAGRGFFHVSQAGNAEPCPFSPISVANVGEVGLRGALASPFFERVRAIEAAHADEHMRGCTLCAHQKKVRAAQSVSI